LFLNLTIYNEKSLIKKGTAKVSMAKKKALVSYIYFGSNNVSAKIGVT